MAEDEKVVQAENVSTETTSKETETTDKSGQSQDAAFNEAQEARMQQLIAEATTKALEQGKETGKREMQGAKDREVAEAKRATRLAEDRAKVMTSSLSGLDEESRKEVELAQLRQERNIYADAEKEDRAVKAQEQYAERLVNSINESIRELGIDTADKRLDWATGERIDPVEGRQRLDASIAKILKEEEGKRMTSFQEELKKDFAAMKAELRKDMGLESHDKGDNAGGGSDDDSTFYSAFAAGTVEPTAANLKRIEEIQAKRLSE